MEQKLSRKDIQVQALDKLFENNGRGTICMETGTGKSKVGIDFIKRKSDIVKVLITSPRTNLKENWKKELTKWGLKQIDTFTWFVKDQPGRVLYIDIENIQSAYKWKNMGHDLIIADEIHTMMTPEYSKVFERQKSKYLIGFTATHDIQPGKNDKEWYYKRYCPIIYQYYKAADDNIINKTKFLVFNHQLTDKVKVLAGSKKRRFWAGELSQYDYWSNQIKEGQRLMSEQMSTNFFDDARQWFWNKKGTKLQAHAARVYLTGIQKRRELLSKLNSTAGIARTLSDKVLARNADNKVLIFSELTEQVEKITKNTVHSHNHEDVNQEMLDKFNSGEIRELGSCQSLTLGLNLTKATHGIMESFVGSATRSTQKKGRLDRLGTGNIATMVFIKVIGTQSEKWFDSMVSGFKFTDDNYFESDSLNEIIERL